jgi:hypothetical protein
VTAFSPREVALLGEIAETFVAGDGAARGQLAPEALELARRLSRVVLAET